MFIRVQNCFFIFVFESDFSACICGHELFPDIKRSPLTDFFTTILCILILAGLAYHALALFCIREFFRRPAAAPSAPSASPAPLSVLKPLAGIDPGFRENLASFLLQDHPAFEIVLGLSEQDRAAANEVRQLVAGLKDPRVRVVTSSHGLGPNRKVSNLQGLVEAAQWPLLVLSDSDMRAGPRYLSTIAAEYAEQRVGIVTNLYAIRSPRTAGSALESLTIALDLIPSVLVARRLEGVTFALGASILVSRGTLEEIGGLGPIADYLADDYQLGNRTWRQGYKIVLSSVVLETVPGPMTLRDHILHQVRWARTYRASRPRGFAGYGITHVLFLSLVLLLLLGATPLSLSLAGAALAVRVGEALLLETYVIRSKRWFAWLALFPVKDVLAFCIWAWSFIGNTVSWRGRTFSVLPNGRIREGTGK